ncbi:unnamed protein product [Leptosia nina]|uniref:Uncharacterized protein n=1 Tax=Leptosia nina TaxID=320188 RepID=A0AAV1ITK6_9NEOP
MTTRLEELLFRSLVECDETAVLHYVSKGANPNKITSQGKTCLGEACRRGIISLVKLLLESCNEDSTEISNVDLKRKRFKSHKRKFKAIEYNGNVSKCEHRSEEYQVDGNKSKLNSNKSQDYVVLLSSDGSSSDESRIGCNSKSPTSPLSSTTVPLADLEWDEDIGTFAPNTSEDETWSSMYRWYAAILEDTGAAIAAAAKVSNGINQQDAFMRTALHYAAEQGHTEVVKLLLDSGSKLDLIAGDGLTSLHVSVIKNNIETVKLLLSAGSQINYKTHEKMTALHFAASRGYLEIVKLLINSGAYIEARDTNERTALYLASGRGHVDVIQYLIFSGANVNGEEIHGYTPLCEAVWHSVEALTYPMMLVIHLFY